MNTALRATLLPIYIGAAFGSSTVAAAEWGVGMGLAQYQSPQKGITEEVMGGPFVTYHGERLNVDFTNISYLLLDSTSYQLAMEGDARFEGYKPSKTSDLAGMQTRDASFDVGVSVTRKRPWGEAELKLLADATGTYEGYELSVQIQKPFTLNRWMIMPAVGLRRQDEALVDYYYGVRVDESTRERPQYSGRATTNAFAEFTFAYPLSRHWHFIGGMEAVHLGDSIEQSPIVDKAYNINTFSALIYTY